MKQGTVPHAVPGCCECFQQCRIARAGSAPPVALKMSSKEGVVVASSGLANRKQLVLLKKAIMKSLRTLIGWRLTGGVLQVDVELQVLLSVARVWAMGTLEGLLARVDHSVPLEHERPLPSSERLSTDTALQCFRRTFVVCHDTTW